MQQDARSGCASGAARSRELGAIVADAGARAELKAYLRIEGGDEDTALDRLIAVAIAHGEAFTGRLWLIRAAHETLTPSAEWRRLGVTPVRSIDAVGALDLAGAATPLAPDAYAIDIDAAGDGRVRIVASLAVCRVRVDCQAGLASAWTGLPDPLRQGALRLAAHLFTHRDSADEGAPPAAVAALWRPWRRMRIS